MAKTAEKEVQKGAYRCSNCSHEFVGTECPDCGNSKGNVKLASDLIDQKLHSKEYLFSDLKPIEGTEADLLQMKAAKVQVQEFEDNMREAFVARSELKKAEAQIQKLRKEAELAEARANLASGKPIASSPIQPGGGYPGAEQSSFGFPFMGMNPQTAFMSQLMKMDKEKRQEFLSQLSEADPQALSSLSAMLAPTMPGPGWGMGGGMGGGSAGMNMPPWMMWQTMQQQMMNQQQQQQPQQQQADPTETALSMMSTMMDLVAKLQPKTDEGLKEMLREYKEELKSMREKMQPGPQSGAVDNRVLEKIASLESQVANTNSRRGFADSFTEVMGFVKGLEEAGIVKRAGSEGKTVDDELKLKKFEHEKSIEEKKMSIEEKRVEAEKVKATTNQGIMAAMFQRALVRNREGQEEGPARKVSAGIPVAGSAAPRVEGVERVERPPELKPVAIIEERLSEAGRVFETRAPVKRSASEVI